MKNDLSEIHSVARRSKNLRLLPIMIIGEAETAKSVKRLLEDNSDLDVQVLTCAGIEAGLALMSFDTGIALFLLLWQSGNPGHLPDLVRSILERQSSPKLAVMVRSQTMLPEDVSSGLWRLGVADRSFYQNILSTEFVDSVAVAVRNCRRQFTLTDIPDLSRIFPGAKTMRDLAHLSLLAVHEQIAVKGGLFCYHGRFVEHQPMLISGTGCHENYSCIPLERIEDRLVKDMIQAALSQCRSQFRNDRAAIYLLTPGGYSACIYFTLDLPLRTWEAEVLQAISGMMANAIDHIQLALQLLRTQHATITGMSALAEYRDADTGEHIARVARLTTEISWIFSEEYKEIDAKFLAQIGLASTLHDAGKIAIPDSILLKQGPLNHHERLTMQQHVTFGHDVLIKVARHTDDGALFRMSADIARYHHERFDGKGYPEGLKGEDIPLSARIVALVDVYDALTSKRPYKLPWPHETVVDFIRSESGCHFDPKVVDAFMRLEEIKKSSRHIEWNENMSVNHNDLDFDHQRLIEIINRLWVAESMGNRQIIEFVLDDLVNYTEFHFLREEGLMQQAEFPGRERHCKIHHGICRRLEEIRWEYFQGIRDELRKDLLEFVTYWLNKHILEEDMQFSSFFATVTTNLDIR